ncbi:putative uncharacterized protein [Aliivibrio wodanis]|uniref:Uncharacterized protein n=1 Tax=Aliivibrio wodanis TaxID=80852 RepID=A0A090I8Y4_9GAMM|nr:putative uncharacterized protein [Aliivibrio wodanis]
MNDYNNDYYILKCGSSKVPSPYCACCKDHYFIYQNPLSLKMAVQAESSGELEDNIPLIEAMEMDGDPLLSKRVKQVLEFFDLYCFQLQPAIYTHADDTEHFYWVGVLDNALNVYDFEQGNYYTIREYDEVNAKTIRLDPDKMSVIPLEKRLMFEVPGMRGTYIVHRSVAEPLIALNASGLHLVPVMEWTNGFGMTI